jgi:hypothetical protein
MNSDVQCPGGKVLILASYYTVREHASGPDTRLLVRLDSICLPADSRTITSEQDAINEINQILAESQPSRSSRPAIEIRTLTLDPVHHAEWLARLREATSDYLTDHLTGTMLETQLWPSSRPFFSVPKRVDDALKQLNSGLSSILTDKMRKAMPPDVAGAGSEIATDLLLAPIAKPINTAIRGVALAGFAVAIITMQPHLAVTCAKVYAEKKAREEIGQMINKSIATMSQQLAKDLDMAPAASNNPASGEGPKHGVAAKNKASRRAKETSARSIGYLS